jgi:hypothetical protein
MKKVTAWRCEWCDSVYLKGEDTKEHESRCDRDPSKKSCTTCWKNPRKSAYCERFGEVRYDYVWGCEWWEPRKDDQ